MWIADNGVQVLGGHGFIREHPVEMWFSNARTLGVLEGTAGDLVEPEFAEDEHARPVAGS